MQNDLTPIRDALINALNIARVDNWPENHKIIQSAIAHLAAIERTPSDCRTLEFSQKAFDYALAESDRVLADRCKNNQLKDEHGEGNGISLIAFIKFYIECLNRTPAAAPMISDAVFDRCVAAVRALEVGFDYDSTAGSAILVNTVLAALHPSQQGGGV